MIDSREGFDIDSTEGFKIMKVSHKDNDLFLKLRYFYSSFRGYMCRDVHKVKPRKKTITVYD